ncbi:PREDICTED: uncharacterized protein LOC104372159 [Tauraco erythrolophus]|uniref:uncharacterized protein LOC104372159 n=1 Tax=Tauraco erythrolophus TaxID=121530 RepID=UPI00052327BA|nr:PREDICTED: uncharacterized protein LOC104372159 [Tauraco erythrolophus]
MADKEGVTLSLEEEGEDADMDLEGNIMPRDVPITGPFGTWSYRNDVDAEVGAGLRCPWSPAPCPGCLALAGFSSPTMGTVALCAVPGPRCCGTGLGTGGVRSVSCCLSLDASVPNVQVTRLTLMCEQAPGPITMDLTGDLEMLRGRAFVLKEGVDYRVKVSFKAPHGWLARGSYRVRSLVTDDDKMEHLSWEWGLCIKKAWED